MRTNDLLKFIALDELEIIKIYNESENACILFEAPVDIELIANGYRPSIEMTPKHLVVFKGISLKESSNRKYIISHEEIEASLTLHTTDGDIEITDCEIEFKPNFIFDDGITK